MRIEAENPRALLLGIERTRAILRQHSLPGHLLNALLRQMDPEVARQAKRAEALLADEKTPADGSKPAKGDKPQ
jgi:regulator of protease activity HflC (stomatin/prohibitin superfamily)